MGEMTTKKWYVNVNIAKEACFTVEAKDMEEAEEKARKFETLEKETEDEKVVSVAEIKRVGGNPTDEFKDVGG